MNPCFMIAGIPECQQGVIVELHPKTLPLQSDASSLRQNSQPHAVSGLLL